MFDGPMTTDINLIFDISHCQFGDEFIFSIQCNTSNVINYDSNTYVTGCGGQQPSSPQISERYVIYFFFDGTKFVNTYDTC